MTFIHWTSTGPNGEIYGYDSEITDYSLQPYQRTMAEALASGHAIIRMTRDDPKSWMASLVEVAFDRRLKQMAHAARNTKLCIAARVIRRADMMRRRKRYLRIRARRHNP